MSDVPNRYRTMQEIVYETIKERVLKGQYRPGQRLVTNDISSELHVTRMPVREALQRLEAATGLIRLIPHKGAVVRDSSREDLCDVFRIRVVLEGLAARLTCAHITNGALEEMERLNCSIEELSHANDEDDFEQLNLRFHSIIWESTNSQRLIGMLRSLYDSSRSYRYSSLKLPGRLDEIVREHRQIIFAFKQRDAGQAEQIVTKHYQSTLEWLLRANRRD